MKRALVVGCSDRVWRDVETAMRMCAFDAFYVVKLAGCHWRGPPFSWITLHPEFMAKYIEKRHARGLPDDWEIVAPARTEYSPNHHGEAKRLMELYRYREVTYRWPGMTSSGSSGMYGIKVALDDGADRVVIAGIPMTKEAGHFERKNPWMQVDAFTRGWEVGLPFLKEQTRSVSGGWTEELLGVPTPDWLGVPDQQLDAPDWLSEMLGTVADGMSAK